MDTIAARAVTSVETDACRTSKELSITSVETDARTTPKNHLTTAEGTTNAMTTAHLSHFEGRQRRWVLIPLVVAVAVATGMTAWLFAAGEAPIGIVTGVFTVLAAIITGSGKVKWLLGHGRRGPATEGLVTQSH